LKSRKNDEDVLSALSGKGVTLGQAAELWQVHQEGRDGYDPPHHKGSHVRPQNGQRATTLVFTATTSHR
jgi:hypothetical protein